MIDVHPPHHAATTRRDFFIHLTTVVLGILIALGLEQTVEFFHHRHQLTEARAQLATEYKMNLAVFRAQRVEFDRFVPLLQRDLDILTWLRAHPGAPHNTWPGQLSWFYTSPTYVDATWKSLQNTELLTLMPQPELQRNNQLYRVLENINDDHQEATELIWRSFSYGVRNQDPAAMSTAQIDDAIQSVTEALRLYARMVNFQIGLSQTFKDFTPAPNFADMRKISRVASPPQDQAAGMALNQGLAEELARIQAEAEKTK